MNDAFQITIGIYMFIVLNLYTFVQRLHGRHLVCPDDMVVYTGLYTGFNVVVIYVYTCLGDNFRK